jgi:hypothetical protein
VFVAEGEYKLSGKSETSWSGGIMYNHLHDVGESLICCHTSGYKNIPGWMLCEPLVLVFGERHSAADHLSLTSPTEHALIAGNYVG